MSTSGSERPPGTATEEKDIKDLAFGESMGGYDKLARGGKGDNKSIRYRQAAVKKTSS